MPVFVFMPFLMDCMTPTRYSKKQGRLGRKSTSRKGPISQSNNQWGIKKIRAD